MGKTSKWIASVPLLKLTDWFKGVITESEWKIEWKTMDTGCNQIPELTGFVYDLIVKRLL